MRDTTEAYRHIDGRAHADAKEHVSAHMWQGTFAHNRKTIDA
jgi:hypothetical protein